MLVRYGLGASPAATGAYAEWAASVTALLQSVYGDAWRAHGGATVMPSNVPAGMQQYAGQPAARFDSATYAQLANAGYLDMSRPQVASNNGQLVYVLAPYVAIAAAPPTMTAAQQAENAIFTAGDNAADALGLPSLTGLEDMLKGLGTQILVGVGVTIGVAVLLKSMRKR